MEHWFASWQAWVMAVGILLAAVVAALIVHRIIFGLARRAAAHSGGVVDNLLVRYGEKPMKWILPLLAVELALPALPIPADYVDEIRHALGLGLIGGVAWVVALLAHVFTDSVAVRYPVNVEDNLQARRVRTQLQVLRRIFLVVVSVVTLAVMLMTFPAIRQMGTSILASAGLAGLIVGMAMKPTLSSLIAGLQIAMTEPIRIDDVVIVEGEWGWIEEIQTTYVVVRIWDLRRLVVPLSYFIEHPFQNWTRRTAELLGTVFVYTDYTVPVAAVREELRHILESSGKWDGKVCALEVTDANAHTMELRALMSAPDSSKAWDLRCLVREKLIDFLQQHYPESLPKSRAEIQHLPARVHAPGPRPRPQYASS